MISLHHINLYERGDNQCHGVFILIVDIQGDIATTMDAIDHQEDAVTIKNTAGGSRPRLSVRQAVVSYSGESRIESCMIKAAGTILR